MADTYVINSGVRRAKAAELAGHTTITAEVYDPSGPLIGVRDIPLAQLLSRKAILDLRSDVRELIRFRRLQSLILAGVVLDPIEVEPGTVGTPLSAVQVLT
jgi:hypothetical protein